MVTLPPGVPPAIWHKPTPPAETNDQAALAKAAPRKLDIRLQSDSPDVTVLGEGWGRSERHGTWSLGLRSAIHIELDDRHAYRCVMPLAPFLAPPRLASRQLVLRANGFVVFTGTLDGPARVTFEIPRSLLRVRPTLELVLETDHAVSPSSLGVGIDVRELSFSVFGLSIEAIAERPGAQEIRRELPEPRERRWRGPLSAPVKIAAVTMVYNEQEYLPIWLRHYGAQVGLENCYIIDHGSSDGSTQGLDGCNVLRIPRSPYDPHRQSAFNTEFCNSLLQWFDWVIYCDADEFLVPDPLVASSLAEYCRGPLPDVVTAIGLNMVHLPQSEPELDLRQPITAQRRHVFCASSMCKPLLTRRPIQWSPGSHSADAPMRFDHLYMFHLRWFDLTLGLRRLARTRAMAWARTDAGAHARVDDGQFARQLESFAKLPLADNDDLDPSNPPLLGFLDRVAASRESRENDLYKLDLNIWPTNIWKLPTRFVGLF